MENSSADQWASEKTKHALDELFGATFAYKEGNTHEETRINNHNQLSLGRACLRATGIGQAQRHSFARNTGEAQENKDY